MQDCRTDCGCKQTKQEDGLDIPDTPCAWPVHATAQHHTVISTALPFLSLPSLPAWKGDGLAGWTCLGGSSGGSWVVPWLHFTMQALTRSLPVPGFGSGPRFWVFQSSRDGCISPVLILTCGSYLLVVAKGQWGKESTHRRKEEASERGRSKESKETRRASARPMFPCSRVPMLCCAALCCAAANSSNVD